ncbi:MAG: LytTR family DNA-binding domain-containing protein [Clostridium sp.]
MRIKIEADENIQYEEVIIRCKELNEDILKIQVALNELLSQKTQIAFYKEEKEFYFSLDKIIFFESEGEIINGHAKEDVYEVKYKLYELEEILPKSFIRVSKSTILNVKYIYSITKNITSSSLVEFSGTHKKVYVSRRYFKVLKEKLLERRG